MYYTYVLICRNDGERPDFYIGFTNDLRKRVAAHKAKGVNWTKKFDTIDLIYYEACANKKDVQEREFQLKTGFGRGYLKRRLVNYLAGLV